MAHRGIVTAGLAASVLLTLVAIAGCASDLSASPTSTPAVTTSATASPTPIPTITGTPSALTALPDDCREMIADDDVRAQLADVPLNDPATGEDTGVQADGSLVCLWREPAADTTFLMTSVAYLSRGEALDVLNELADEEDYTCYTPDGGTRCEKTWENEQYPVTDGRTVFWRDGILIDTRFSNLAPNGYTSSVVAGIFGD